MGKKRQADFQKIKFKVGKIIPKKRNITRTNFSSKKIVLKEQFKHTLETGCSRPHLLKEILPNLKASSKQIVKFSLVRLKEQIEDNDEIFDFDFDAILIRVIQLITSEKKEIHSNAYNVVCLIIKKASKNVLNCFKSLINLQLMNLLTHPHFEVRKRAVKLVYYILSTKPFILSTSFKILNSVLDLLKYQDEHSKSVTNFELPIEAEHLYLWRALIFMVLNKFIQVIHKYYIEKKDDQLNNESSLNIQNLVFTNFEPKYNCFENDSENDAEIEELKQFAVVLMPIIYGVHKEEIATREGNAEGSTMYECASNVKVMLQIIYYLMECFKLITKEDLVMWFKKNESMRFAKNLIKYFPYHQIKTFHKGKKSQREFCHNSNLHFCLIYSTFILGTTWVKSDFKMRLATYLKDLIDLKLKNIPFSFIIEITRNLIKDDLHSSYGMEIFVHLVKLVEKSSYNQETHMIIDLFFEFVLSPTFYDILVHQPFKDMMELLVELLIEYDFPYTEKLSLAVNTLCNKPELHFMQSCQKHCYQLIEIIPKKNADIQLLLIKIIIHLPKLSTDYFKRCSEIFIQPSVSIHNIHYMMHKLTKRLLSDNCNFDGQDYLKFILSLITGSYLAKGNFQVYDKNNEDIFPLSSDSYFIISPAKNLAHKLQLFECGIQELMPLSSHLPVYSYIQLFAWFILTSARRHCLKLPVNCLIALLKIYKEIDEDMLNEESKKFQQELYLSSLLYMYCSPMEKDDSLDEGFSELLSCLPISANSIKFCLNSIAHKLPCNIDSKFAYGLLQMLLFFTNSNLIINEHREDLMSILGKIKQNFGFQFEDWVKELYRTYGYY